MLIGKIVKEKELKNVLNSLTPFLFSDFYILIE
jgi:hypothetical protein